MFKIIFVWLFCLGILIDIPIMILHFCDWISWGWGIIIAIPFVLAFAGTLAFAILYGILKFFITLIMLL